MQNDMRDRLIKLLKTPNKSVILRKANPQFVTEETDEESIVADYLIANGVIVPPCKVGDTVYLVRGKCTCNKAVCLENGGIGITRCETEPCDAHIQEVPFSLCLFNALGKTVFLTKEEAEMKLRELNDDQL